MPNRLVLHVAVSALCAFFIASQTKAQDAPGAPTAKPGATQGSATAPKGGQTSVTKTAGQSSAAKTGQGTTAVRKPGTATPVAPTTEKEKASYAIGVNIGKNLQHDGVDVDPAMVQRGIRDTVSGKKLLLTDDEMKTALTGLSTELKKKHDAEVAAAGEANRKEGETFLAANKAKEGVIALPDGLQYKILTPGDGPKPTATDTVIANYKGTLIDGTEFDSSYKRGQPATFPVGRVIKGWTEILQLMPVGSKWEVYIPSDLAYGPQGPGRGPIGPNETLIFEIELVSIQPKAANPPPATPPPATPQH